MMLEARDVCFSYRRDGDELFGGLTHEFAAGTVTAITGASGRGKSTLLFVLGLLLRPRSGDVLIKGISASSRSDRSRSAARSSSIGFVFQDSSLDASRTILDSVIEPALYAGMLRAQAEVKARVLLAEFGLAHRIDHHPGHVSGGQAQRVGVARALINDPAIILADEPTGNLDHETATGVLDALAGAAAGGRAVVIATHDQHVIGYADEVLRL